MFRRITNPPASGTLKCSGGFAIRLQWASKNVQADLQSACSEHPKLFRRICNPPATGTLNVQADLQSACNVYKDFQSATPVPFFLLFCILYFFFSDYKSLYSMMPDFKSGITLSFFPPCSVVFAIRLHLASKNVQADL